ncbi:VanZ family protein [Mangrovimonas futianensis]|uniref:VanZ family protein n=2 Tax=Mangrovimonas TaxID=1211036 RepID=UPI003AB98BF8
MLRKRTFLITILYTLCLTIVCLMTIDMDKVEEYAPSYIDKIFHFCAYLLFNGFWFATFVIRFGKRKRIAFFYAIIFSVIFGIIIECLQWLITTSRSFDLIDILFNIAGVLVSSLLITGYFKLVKKQ